MTTLAAIQALLQQGDVARAAAALDALPGDLGASVAALRLRAWVAWRQGRADDAIDTMRRASGEAAGLLPMLELGQMLAQAGRMDEARASLRAAVERHPGSPDAWYALGMVEYQARDDSAARDAFEHALDCAPGQPVLLRALAEAEVALERHARALPLFEKVLASAPDTPDPMLMLRVAQCRRRTGDAIGALAAIDTAIAADPQQAALWLERGWIQEDRGDAAAAAEAYEQASRLAPGWADPVGSAIALLRREAPEPLLERARVIARAAEVPPQQRAFLHQVLGRHADAAGSYADAAAHWDAGNALRRAQDGAFDRAAYRAQVDALIADMDADGLRTLHARAWPDPRPVFVLGMPRSGTTLAEQILAAHPDVHGCGELKGIVGIAEAAARRVAWPAGAGALEPAWMHAQARTYLADASRAAPAGVQRLVDKQPYNFLHVGLLAMLFADARVVWCRRDPRDIAVSIYGENFAPSATYATDLGDIAFVIAQQERLMRHWQRVSPLPLLELQYEDVVAEPDRQIRRLIAFAGLPWDDACLGFHASGRSVHTISRWQVRQPVHGRSVGRWRHYPRWFPESVDPPG